MTGCSNNTFDHFCYPSVLTILLSSIDHLPIPYHHKPLCNPQLPTVSKMIPSLTQKRTKPAQKPKQTLFICYLLFCVGYIRGIYSLKEHCLEALSMDKKWREKLRALIIKLLIDEVVFWAAQHFRHPLPLIVCNYCELLSENFIPHFFSEKRTPE